MLSSTKKYRRRATDSDFLWMIVLKVKKYYLKEPENLKHGYHINTEHKRWEDTRLNAARVNYEAKERTDLSNKYCRKRNGIVYSSYNHG